MTPPREATIAVTSRCNSRCVMCNIWRETEHIELPPEEYTKLPESLRIINVTGGEPFMRKDIVEVVRRIHDAAPRSRIVISTNGFLTDKIVQAMSEIRRFHRRIGIGVSVDGIGEVHDRIRGMSGSFDRAVETVRKVKELGVEDVRIGMTIVPENQHQVQRVYELAKDLGVEFTTTIAHNSGIYFKKTDNRPGEVTDDLRRDLRNVMGEHLRSLDVKCWFRAYHLAGVVNPEMRTQAAGRCGAAQRFFYMDSKGDVYPCIVMDRVIGNMRAYKGFDELFSSSKANDARRAVNKCTQDCWMVCNIRSFILSHPGTPVVWIAKNKARAHFSRGSRS